MEQALPKLSVVDEIVGLSDAIRRRGVEVVGPWGSAKAVIAAQLAQALDASLVYVTQGRIEAEGAYEDLRTLLGEEDLVLLPAWEVLPTDSMEPTVDIIAERMDALQKISAARHDGRPIYASVSARALLQRVVNPTLLGRDTIALKVGEEHDLEALAERLTEMGYERELMVEQRGQISIRGGIFDVFPISSELPYRLEFFGDEIESIRRFEPETQRSVETLEAVDILPRSEKKLIAEQTKDAQSLDALREYFDERTILVVDEPVAVAQEAAMLEEQFGDSPFMTTWDEAAPDEAFATRLEIAQVAYKSTAADSKRLTVSMNSMSGWAGQVDGFWDQLTQWESDEFCVQLLCNNTGERRRLLELLEEHGYRVGEGRFDLRLDLGRMRAGFASSSDRLAVLSEQEIFGRKYVRRTRRRFAAGTAITTFSDLKAGDYVVHVHHGIGRYLGIRRFSDKTGDFLGIQYAGKDIIYVPVSHVDHVQRYMGGDGAVPKMDKLGGATWARKRGDVKKAVREMTEELLKLYAARESQEGHAFSKDTHWQHEFEESFEYEETPDQLRAINEVKADMESSRPMERLLCGDVGFGKTEVALRAAFKAVMDGFQVAVLVPTTILAEQHFHTFTERFADYPITVEMLSRFRTSAQQRDTVRRLKAGEVDVVVGTHRLTSGDVNFKRLGLVVLDEEQRFGVKHKERLKQLKTNVDVLSLSATPIPRTMYMSLMGVRDMSVINTAPNDRLPIHTRIDVYDDKLVAEAIGREVARNGQVFYLHNRVGSIEKVAARIKKLVPHARVAIGHGQMPEHALEKVMAAFIRNEYNVLVCTTIIGSGLDIPNANTIIVDRADQFGLSELYQVRGRVGRYKHRAFAYLLIPGDKALSEVAQKRLKALEEFSTLGSGFRIAMRDLEIRGTGNLLGHRQSGHIASVGYDAYMQLIRETVAELKGAPRKIYDLPPFDIASDGAIPNDYVASESQKIALYKRIATLHSNDEIDDMVEELKDRFGKPPAPVHRLLNIMRVRALGGEVGARRIALTKKALVIELPGPEYIDKSVQEQLNERFPARLQFALNDKPYVSCSLRENEEPVALAKELLSAILDL